MVRITHNSESAKIPALESGTCDSLSPESTTDDAFLCGAPNDSGPTTSNRVNIFRMPAVFNAGRIGRSDGDEKYQSMIKEQAVAITNTHFGVSPKVRRTGKKYDEFFSVAAQLSDALRSQRISLGDLFTDEDAHLIDQALYKGRNSIAANKAKSASAAGEKIFAAFTGHWRGTWSQDGNTTEYDHAWDSPRDVSRDMAVQIVSIGRWDSVTAKRLDPELGINTFDRKTGIIVGAVGYKDGVALRPHVGFYVDPQTLIWMAYEGESNGEPQYSLFLEHVDHDVYTVRGVGLSYNPISHEFTVTHEARGKYGKVE